MSSPIAYKSEGTGPLGGGPVVVNVPIDGGAIVDSVLDPIVAFIEANVPDLPAPFDTIISTIADAFDNDTTKAIGEFIVRQLEGPFPPGVQVVVDIKGDSVDSATIEYNPDHPSPEPSGSLGFFGEHGVVFDPVVVRTDVWEERPCSSQEDIQDAEDEFEEAREEWTGWFEDEDNLVEAAEYQTASAEWFSSLPSVSGPPPEPPWPPRPTRPTPAKTGRQRGRRFDVIWYLRSKTGVVANIPLQHGFFWIWTECVD